MESDQAIVEFMCAALETNDTGCVTHALGVVVRARGITKIAHRTGLSGEERRCPFSSEEDPALRTTLTALQTVGVRLLAMSAETGKA